MFSKIAVLSLFIFSVLGCGKGSSPDAGGGQVVRLKVGGVECFNGMGTRFAHYFAGTAAPGELHQGFACIHQVVTDFTSLTTGAKSDSYNQEEIREFVARYYLKNGFPPSVMTSTMGLKQILVGGSADEITRAEIVILLQKFDQLDAATEALRPFTKIIFSDGNSSATDAQWDQAYGVLARGIALLGGELPGATAPYNLDALTAFLTNWADYLDVSSSNALRTIATNMPVIAAAKVILVGGTANEVAPSEWPKLFSALDDAYAGVRLAERIFDASPDDVSQILASPRFEPLIEKLFGFIENGVRAHQPQSIPFTEVDLLMTRVEQTGALPKTMTANSLGGLVRFFFTKFFSSPTADPNGIDLARVIEMKKLLSNWRANQTALETNDYTNATDLMQATHPGWAMTFDPQGRLQIPPDQKQGPREFSFLFTVLKWTGEKWGSWPLDENSFHALVKDFVDQLHSFDIMSTTTDVIYKRLLREANLFLPSSTGDAKLDTSEAFQYAMFITSAYRGAHLLTSQTKSCGADSACAQAILFKNRSEILSNFPKLLSWIGSDQKRFQDFDQKLVTIAGDGNWVVHFVVFHYIENFLQRFDANDDGMIDLKEATTSYAIYGNVLGEMLGNVGFDPKETWPLYTFMFKYGATPFSVFGGSARYVYWKWYPSSWVIHADRSTLAGILSELAKL